MRVITYEDKQEINRLYKQLKTYAAVARQMGISPATVKKYIVADFKEVDASTFIRFDRPLPEFDPKPFRTDDWGSLCELSNEEIEEIHKLWEEIEV